MNLKDWAKIRLLAVDFDGVLTDGKVIVSAGGDEAVVCSHLDGQGKDQLQEIGLPMVIISSQKSDYVPRRGGKLGIDYFHQVRDKGAQLRNYLAEKHPSVSLDQVCFMGDDHGDLVVMKIVGFPVAVANATDEIKAVARYVTTSRGGDGAFREVCELILAARASVKPKIPPTKMVLITGTGERTTQETAVAVEETAYRLAMAGHVILTNSGRNGVPEAAANGVKRARDGSNFGYSIAYAYMPGLTAEICGTTEIRHFDSFETRNGIICRDADVAVFFQGGFGTMAKLFSLIQRVAHINGLLESKGLTDDVRLKQIILHESFARSEDLAKIMGATFGVKHQAAITLARTLEEILRLIK